MATHSNARQESQTCCRTAAQSNHLIAGSSVGEGCMNSMLVRAGTLVEFACKTAHPRGSQCPWVISLQAGDILLQALGLRVHMLRS
eukprot:5957136-Amphidinium_carterae.2